MAADHHPRIHHGCLYSPTDGSAECISLRYWDCLHLVDELEKRQYLGFLSQDDDPSKRAVKRWKEKLPQGRVIIGSYDGHKDLNEMATKVGWDAIRKRLFALLEKAGFEYEYEGNQDEKNLVLLHKRKQKKLTGTSNSAILSHEV